MALMKLKLCVDISVSCFIDADDLMMHHIETGDTKPYSQINVDDINDWVVYDCKDVLDKSYDTEFESIDIDDV